MTIKLSFVVPLFNETDRLRDGFEELRAYMDSRDFECEAVFVDDGSSDNTADRVRELTGDDSRFRLIDYPVNKGKGHAVKVGMLEAKGEIRLFTDIDMSVPAQAADEFLAKIDAGADVVIGTRKTKQSKVVVHQPKYREVLGEIFRQLTQKFFAPGITDFTCGFKAFKAEPAEKIFAASIIPRWSFDVEILLMAVKWGYDVREVPVAWTNSPSTKVRLIVDAWRTARELTLIQWYKLTGKYDKK